MPVLSATIPPALPAPAAPAVAGLTAAEAQEGLRRHGPNAVETTPLASWWQVLLRQFRGLIVAVLAVAAVLSFVFNDRAEGYAILAVILINGLIGFWLEWRAQSSMTALRLMGRTTARVLRDDAVQAIPADQVTIGDVLLVEAGEVVAADADLFEAQQLQVNESALTGESMPISKALAVSALEAPPTEPTHRLFKGTAVVNGTGRATVTGIGGGTQLGEIAQLVQKAERSATPLEAKLATLAHQLVFATAAMAAVYVGAGLLRGQGGYKLLEMAIVLAVAAIPEGMSIVATLALAYGMLRLAERQVLVKRLAAVETLGGTDIIFTDKTGTLTQNQMAVQTVWLPEARRDFVVEAGAAASPAAPAAAAAPAPAPPAPAPAPTSAAYELLLRAAVRCNNATYSPTETKAALGDPLEVALLVLAYQSGGDAPAAERLAEQPFNSDTRLMATLHREADGTALVAAKGAAEAVLPACTQQQTATGPKPLADEARAEWLARAEALAQTGLRVLALAHRPGADETPTGLVRELTFLGLVAFLDPPRAEVIPAIEACRQAGIRVLMVTGDHPATALTVARQVHLVTAADTEAASAVVSGTELPALLADPAAAAARLLQTHVFARVSPAQKLELIRFYQQQGHVVAMIGDGVNDAPALKKADIGVAMGLRGTQVAAEAAALVLRDDSFASVVAAVEQGRIIFTNIRRFVLYLVSCNLSELLVVMVAGVLGGGAVLLPLQILFLNLVTDVFPAFALSVGRGSPHVMEHPPFSPNGPMMRFGDWVMAAAYAALMTGALLGSYYLARHQGNFTPAATTTMLFYGLALAQMVHVFNMTGVRTALRDNDVVRNRYVWLALALCAGLLLLTYYVPVLRHLLGLQLLPLDGLLFVGAPAVATLVFGQLLGYLIGKFQPPLPDAQAAPALSPTAV